MTPAEHAQNQQPILKAYLDHELPPWRRWLVRLHLARCASCREEMQAMQQIGNELRGQRLDPLDPVLRSRILETVREMKPDPVAPTPVISRRPVLIWGGTALAAALLAVFFLPNSPMSRSPMRNKAMVALEKMDKSEAQTMSSSTPPAEGSPVVSAPKSVMEPQETEADKLTHSIPLSGTLAHKAPSAGSGFGGSAHPSGGSIGSAGRPSSGGGGRGEGPLLKQEVARVDQEVGDAQKRSSGLVGAMPNQPTTPVTPPANSPAIAPMSSAKMPLAAPPAMASMDRTMASKSTGGGRRPGGAGDQAEFKVAHGYGGQRSGQTKSLPTDLAKPILLASAGFDLQGYRFVTQTGRTILVPFKKSLNAVRFARAADGKMALSEDSISPILFLGPADTLTNAAVPEGRWQPLPPSAPAAQPLYVHPAPTWDQFIALRWYPRMTLIGGLTKSAVGDATFTWLPGSQVKIGEVVYPDLGAYRAYADAHPEALRLRAVYDTPSAGVPSLTGPTGVPGAADKKPRP